MKDLTTLPDGLPVPIDDGACDHLASMKFPPIEMICTSGQIVDLAKSEGVVVLFIYPMTGHPDSLPMDGWNDIPGARGCTPQACSFRDNFSALQQYGITVYGASSQSPKDQQEAKSRLELPYELLSDSGLELSKSLGLPTFEYRSSVFIKRITMIIKNGIIVKTFYPVFPPDKNVDDVIVWLKMMTVPVNTVA